MQGNSCVLIARLLHRPKSQVQVAQVGSSAGAEAAPGFRDLLLHLLLLLLLRLQSPPTSSTPTPPIFPPPSLLVMSQCRIDIEAFYLQVAYLSKIPKGTTSPRVKCFRRKKSQNSYNKFSILIITDFWVLQLKICRC